MGTKPGPYPTLWGVCLGCYSPAVIYIPCWQCFCWCLVLEFLCEVWYCHLLVYSECYIVFPSRFIKTKCFYLYCLMLNHQILKNITSTFCCCSLLTSKIVIIEVFTTSYHCTILSLVCLQAKGFINISKFVLYTDICIYSYLLEGKYIWVYKHQSWDQRSLNEHKLPLKKSRMCMWAL